MEENHHTELQLLPSTASASASSAPFINHKPSSRNNTRPSLDLQLSMTIARPQLTSSYENDTDCVQALKWEASEQIRLAALEKAYAERVRELTRREMELAQSEFACARHVWERAREEVERAERLKEIATARIDDPSTCMEITCHSCRQRFRP